MKQTYSSEVTSVMGVRAGIATYTAESINAYLTQENTDYLLQEDNSSYISRDGTALIVTYSSTFVSTAYVLFINCYDSDGAQVSYTLDDKSSVGFVMTPSAEATIEYLAVNSQ